MDHREEQEKGKKKVRENKAVHNIYQKIQKNKVIGIAIPNDDNVKENYTLIEFQTILLLFLPSFLAVGLSLRLPSRC